MTLKLSKDYAVYSLSKEVLFQGTYQQCLQAQELLDEETSVDVDTTEQVYELQDEALEYNYED